MYTYSTSRVNQEVQYGRARDAGEAADDLNITFHTVSSQMTNEKSCDSL